MVAASMETTDEPKIWLPGHKNRSLWLQMTVFGDKRWRTKNYSGFFVSAAKAMPAGG